MPPHPATTITLSCRIDPIAPPRLIISRRPAFAADDAIANGYVGNVIWGSDYPHFEGTFQYGITSPDGETATRSAMRFTFAGLPLEPTERLLGLNAVHAYGLDEQALRRVAARIDAPTYARLS